jgi:hypothetical protein
LIAAKKDLDEHGEWGPMIEEDLRVETTRQVNAGAPDLLEQGRPQKGSNYESVATLKGKRGNDYRIARLRRDRPDIRGVCPL